MQRGGGADGAPDAAERAGLLGASGGKALRGADERASGGGRLEGELRSSITGCCPLANRLSSNTISGKPSAPEPLLGGVEPRLSLPGGGFDGKTAAGLGDFDGAAEGAAGGAEAWTGGTDAAGLTLAVGAAGGAGGAPRATDGSSRAASNVAGEGPAGAREDASARRPPSPFDGGRSNGDESTAISTESELSGPFVSCVSTAIG